MALSTITVFECTKIEVGPSSGPSVLSELEADELCRMEEKIPGFCVRGYRSIELKQYCGLLKIGERILEVLPKVGENADSTNSQDTLLRLLRHAPDLKLHKLPVTGQANRSSPLLDVFIQAFFKEVLALLKGGLIRRYVEQEEDRLSLKGTLLIQRQLTALANRPDRIACRFDDLTADNPWNRILKAALKAVRPWIGAHHLGRLWVELWASFDEVADIPDALQQLKLLQYDRQAVRYRSALDWAKRILSLLSPTLRAGQTEAPSLLFNMNRLFEAVVEFRMDAWARERGWELKTQYANLSLAEIITEPRRSAFRLRPDLLFRCGSQTMAIADAKWKLPDLQQGFIQPSPEDIYQLHAYASAFRCQQLALIYPWSDKLDAARSTCYELESAASPKPHVSILCLDVGLDDLPLKLMTSEWR